MSDQKREIRRQLRASHTPDQIRNRLRAAPRHSYLRDFIYGAIDGTVTTFAIVSGVAGAGLPAQIVIVLGVANVVADGFSMAASNYLGTRAEEQLREQARQTERDHIRHYPDGEREEIRQIFADKGFRGDDLERAVAIITADVDRWIDTMLTDELGLSLSTPSPMKAAAATLVAFVLVGLVPLLSFVVQLVSPELVAQPYLWSSLLTGVTFFAVGAAKSRFVNESWIWSGMETLLIGGAAALLAYLVGAWLGGLVDLAA
jgi:VIT1/CCC1 family predicted Fe2+/Mn2+ transporter